METEKQEKEERKSQIERYAADLMRLARDTITVRFRFFDIALAGLRLQAKDGIFGFTTDGSTFYYDPAYLLRLYIGEPNAPVRIYLHMLLHCVFFHQFQYDRLNKKYWDLAADIAVENIILEMNMPEAALTQDEEKRARIRKLQKWVPVLTAEKLYKEFMANNPSEDAEREYTRLFTVDYHGNWGNQQERQEIIISEEQWKRITERIRTDLKEFSKGKAGSESLERNIDEATRERYDYRELLERFTVSGEEITVNDEEFDYVYYTYGLMTYGNMPLVEPLEYREVKKVREFVIVIDTSASCSGDMVRRFLARTYEILKGTENFFRQVNVHIIQCDSEIQSDVKITGDADFEYFVSHCKLNGFGTTDFRPAFSYVDALKRQGEFENLKGMIYFTDGYGIYPSHMPEYDVIFAFPEEDDSRQPVPDWAVKVILEDELNEYQSGKGVH